jgi:hypothetical protein
VPLDPDPVVSKLDVRLHTPPQVAQVEAPWVPKTPSNVREIKAHSTLIRERIRRHKSSSPASVFEKVDQLEKAAITSELKIEFLTQRVTRLEHSNEVVTKRRSRKKRRLQKGGTLTKGQGEDIIAQMEADDQIAREERQDRQQSRVNGKTRARCKSCKVTGHNSRTCKKR